MEQIINRNLLKNDNIMKKVLSILAMAVFSFGLFSCEAESTADQEELYIDSPDGHDSDPDKRT
jgi:hypothetical protein